MADALGRRVVTGTIEAMATGNILVQLMAMGEIDSLRARRDIVRRSFKLTTFLPIESPAWDSAYDRFLRLP